MNVVKPDKPSLLSFITVPSFFKSLQPIFRVEKDFLPSAWVSEVRRQGSRMLLLHFLLLHQHPLFLTVTSKQLQFFASTVA